MKYLRLFFLALALVAGSVHGAATVSEAPPIKFYFTDNAGIPLVGGKLFTYQAGTSTKQATYTDSGGSSQNTNPIVLDAAGRASIWLDVTKNYKFVLAPAVDSDPPTTPLWTVDNISPPSASTVYFTQVGTGAVSRSVQDRLRDTVSVKDFGATCDGTTDDTDAILDAIGTGNKTVEFPACDNPYLIGAGDGINILYSNVDLVFARGAVLKKSGTGGAITLARSSNTTINRVGIYGARIISADTTTANSGIVIAPDATNIANYVTIDGVTIDGMGQYGIVQASTSGGASYLSILNTDVLNNGAITGNHTRVALILNPAVGTSTDLTISNVIAEQLNNGTAPETDASKIQNFTRAKISNYTCRGGGDALITGAALVLNNNTDLGASVLEIVGTGASGLQLDTSATGNNNLNTINVTGTFSDAVVLGSNGSNNLSIRGLVTTGGVTTAIGTHERLTIEASTADMGFRLEVGVVNNSIIRNNTTRALNYFVGDSNIIENNTVLSSAGSGIRVDGDSNIIRKNTIISPTSYGVQLGGVMAPADTNVVDDNLITGAGSGQINIANGTGNFIGRTHGGSVSITDSGTSTAFLSMMLGGGTQAQLKVGAGSPEGSVSATVGSLYTRTDGGANTTLYIKESGSGNTGWVAK